MYNNSGLHKPVTESILSGHEGVISQGKNAPFNVEIFVFKSFIMSNLKEIVV